MHQHVHRPLALHGDFRRLLVWLSTLWKLCVLDPDLLEQQHQILLGNGEWLGNSKAPEVVVHSSKVVLTVCRQDCKLVVCIATCST